jgi:hypothetical protein
MALLQLDPALPVLIKQKEAWVKGMAHVLIDYGMEYDILWVVFADESRECWTVANKNVRAQENITAGRPPIPLKVETVPAVAKTNA